MNRSDSRAPATGSAVLLAMLMLPFPAAAGPSEHGAHGHHDHAAHGHDHHGEHASLPQPRDGQRWATDPPLEEGMARIRGAVADALPAYHHGELSSGAAADLARVVNESVAFLLANCELEPEADGVLHVLLVEILAGVRAIDKDPTAEGGMPRIVEALRHYPEYFDDQGWNPL